MSASPVIFNNTVIRDGHQSLAATRMTTEQMIPALEMLDSLGFGCLETWGGATIDAGLRFLNEFPFDRLDALRKRTRTDHMMLLRGQNIVQYAHFPDDVVEAFILNSARHGMNIFRIFDALNDYRNIETAVKAAGKAGAHAQGVLCYTTSPVHTIQKFIEMGQTIEELGCDSICIKDMAGLIPPWVTYDLVKGLKQRVKIPIVLHTHDTAGIGAATYLAGVEAGVDSIDTSIIPFANGTAQPDTERMLAILENHPRQPKYNRATLTELQEYFSKVYAELSDYTDIKNEIIDSDALKYQVPGGMLSNFRNQLKEQNMEDRFEEVMKEIPYVRECLGWIPLVTPTSQITGVQAVMNVKFGRWKQFTPQAMDIALGYYGRTPAPVDPQVQKIAAKNSGRDPITKRPADLKKPGMSVLRAELKEKGYPSDDEHCVIHAMFPSQLDAYYNSRKPSELKDLPIQKEVSGASTSASAAISKNNSRQYGITVSGNTHHVTVEELN